MNNLIEKFNEIRDIPYRIPLTSKEQDFCCSGKMRLLKEWLDNNKFETQYRVCKFKWSSLNLPKEITNIKHEDESTHVYLEVKLNNGWVIVDPTWDKRLKNIFHINEWDSINNCEIAIPVLEKFSDAQSDNIMEEPFDDQDIKTNGEFYKAFNQYLETARK